MAKLTKARGKPLDWQWLGGDSWRAPAPLFGNIRVDNDHRDGFRTSWSVPGLLVELVPGTWGTAEEAKAAAEAEVWKRTLAYRAEPLAASHADLVKRLRDRGETLAGIAVRECENRWAPVDVELASDCALAMEDAAAALSSPQHPSGE